MNVTSGMLGYGKGSQVKPFLVPHGGIMASPEQISQNTTLPMAVAGITKRIVPSQAKKHGLDWYAIDTGYFGNRQSHKNWLRVTLNEYQNSQPLRSRPGSRLHSLRLDRTQFTRGRNIVLVPTHPKVCETWAVGDADAWIASTTALIRQYTDRPVVIRARPASRHDRQYHDIFTDFIREDTYCVVAWTSNCLVEAAAHGIPVISLGPSAALQISSQIHSIDNVPNINVDQQEAWLRHLSYAQFTVREMQSGTAWQMLHE